MTDGSAKFEEVRREVAGLKAQLSDCCPELNQDMTNLERELVNLAEGTVRPTPASLAPAKSAPKSAPVKMSPKPARQFPPSMKQRMVQVAEMHGANKRIGKLRSTYPKGSLRT
jgi:hypothetical protein